MRRLDLAILTAVFLMGGAAARGEPAGALGAGFAPPKHVRTAVVAASWPTERRAHDAHRPRRPLRVAPPSRRIPRAD